jgi:hypothetical protein
MDKIKFGLYWTGGALSYLRYVTFLTLRYNYPDSEIELYVSKTSKHNNDLNVYDPNGDYILDMRKLNVKVIECDLFNNFKSNFQSDLFKWWWLSNNIGYYVDTDMVILSPLNEILEDNKLVGLSYNIKNGTTYYPVAMLGSKSNSSVVEYIRDHVIEHYKEIDSNCIGSKILKYSLTHECFKHEFKSYNLYSNMIVQDKIFYSNVDISNEFAVHLCGYSTAFKDFEKVYTPEYAEKSDDTISVYLKKVGMLGIM